MANNDWRNDAFRNNIKNKLNEAVQQYGIKFPISVDDVEKNVFQRAQTKEEYMTYATKIIKKAQLHAQQQQQQRSMNPEQQQQLQQQNQQTQQQMMLRKQQQQQQLQLQQQQQQQQQQHMQQKNLQQQTHMQQQQQQNQMFLNQRGSEMGNLQNKGNMFPPNMQTIPQNVSQNIPQNSQNNQQTNMMIMQGSPSQNIQMRQMGVPPNNSSMSRAIPQQSGVTVPSPQTSNYQRQQWTQHSPGQFALPRQPGPNSNSMPQQPVLTMPDSNGPLTNSVIPSLSPAHQSPQVPSNSPGLRTPGSSQTSQQAPSPCPLSMNAVPSPASVSTTNQTADEDREYMEKLKQLQKYIEPLSRMIDRFNENEESNKDLSKMKSLRDILMNRKKRLHRSTLDKCEKVLQNWMNPPKQNPGQTIVQRPDQHMCQPILNVIAAHNKSPLLNHTLKRTFGPAMLAFKGGYTLPDYLPSKKQCLQDAVKKLKERQPKIPDIIEGELSRLDGKYQVKIDNSHSNNDGNIHVLCILSDPKLPSVPPLRLSIPKSYPQQPPEWISGLIYADKEDGNDRQTFQDKLASILSARLSVITSSNCTISSIISTWEISVKEAGFANDDFVNIKKEEIVA